MRRILELALIPFFIFVAVMLAWSGLIVLLGSATFIGSVLKGLTMWLFTKLPKIISEVLSDPWKLVALPIAIGVVILFYQWLWKELHKDSFPVVLRGRQIGAPGSRGSGTPRKSVKATEKRRFPPSR